MEIRCRANYLILKVDTPSSVHFLMEAGAGTPGRSNQTGSRAALSAPVDPNFDDFYNDRSSVRLV